MCSVMQLPWNSFRFDARKLETKMWVEDVWSSNQFPRCLLPLAGASVAAGFPSPADDYVEKNLDLNEYLISNPAATFFVRVSGDSMINAGIHDRDILIVDRALTAQSGHVVIAVIEGELMVKRLRQLHRKWVLIPENDAFPPIEIKGEVELIIWGVVTYVVHPL
ncbi:MAG: hypothetical protein C4527_25555 [Candidatus Omnitrophota bacterium]|nr:MAG: hypothetical protein C4527_25555 [Candidatus Omnitrophota bacterium]